jgi:hypothetical protein
VFRSSGLEVTGSYTSPKRSFVKRKACPVPSGHGTGRLLSVRFFGSQSSGAILVEAHKPIGGMVMSFQVSPLALHLRSPLPVFVPGMVLSLSVLLAAGCGGGSGSGSGTGPTFSGNTTVVILASSTANDQLFQFPLALQSLTLTPQSGKAVSLLAGPVSYEFMHLNGHVEPIAIANVPQGIYTSATAILSLADPACGALQSSGGLLMDEGLGALHGSTTVSIEPAQSITVTGSTMGLVLDLQVSKTAPFSGGCSQSLSGMVTITPTFSLTPISIASNPTNSANGKALGVEGLISSVSMDGSGFTAGAIYSVSQDTLPTWQVGVNGSTAFQGVGGAAELAAGMPVDMDLVIEPDGSLLATRVAVYDTDTTNLSVAFGPPAALYPSDPAHSVYPVMYAFQVEQNGQLTALIGSYGLDATSQISGQFSNLQSLPFTAAFNSANLVDGQNVLFTTHSPLGAQFQPVTTITLLPQTIDGTVSGISSAGSFTTYTVTLAPYDLFPNLAVQPAQTTLLTNPDTVVVYADSNTQMLNSSAISAGGLFRFYGLVFNDNGTLRMDCAQINDGVAE